MRTRKKVGERQNMPGESRSKGLAYHAINSNLSPTIERQTTNVNIYRRGTTLIPIPHVGQFAASQREKVDYKDAKTEKNRLRLIWQSKEIVGDSKKNRKIEIKSPRRRPVSYTTIPRYSPNRCTDYQDTNRKEDANVHQPKQSSTFFKAIRNSERVGLYGDSYDSWEARKAPRRSFAPSPDPPLVREAVAVELEPRVFATTQLQSHSQCPSAKVNVAYVLPWPVEAATTKVNKEDAMEPELKEEDEYKSGNLSPELYTSSEKCYDEEDSSEEDGPDTYSRVQRLSSLYHGTWPIDQGIWTGQQMGLLNQQSTSTTVHNDMASVMSFSSSMGVGVGCPVGTHNQRSLGAKVDVVYSLLGMLGGTEGREDMSATLLSMSNSIDSCLAMRQSGCLPLLVQLIHARGQDPETRDRASQALHNVVHAKSDDRAGRREARVETARAAKGLLSYAQIIVRDRSTIR